MSSPDSIKAFHRVKTPTIHQLDEIESGAVAFGIVLGYFGRYLSFEELHEACNVSRDGIDIKDIISAGQKYGLEVKQIHLEAKDLYEIEYPAIIISNSEQYLVLEGFSKERVYINDPATGPRYISHSELKDLFSGRVLVFKKTASFVPGGHLPSFRESIMKRLEGEGSILAFILIAGFCQAIPMLFLAGFMQFFVDTILMENNQDLIKDFFFGLLFSLLVAAAASYLQNITLNRLRARLGLKLSMETFWHLLQLPMSFYAYRYPAEVAFRMAFNDTVSGILTESLIKSSVNAVLAIIFGIAILINSWFLALVIFLAAIINLALFMWVNKSRENAASSYQAELKTYFAFALGGLLNIDTIKAGASEYNFFSQWSGYYTKVANAFNRLGKNDLLISVLPYLLAYISFGILLMVGGWLMLTGQMTPGSLLSIFILTRNFQRPILEFVSQGKNLHVLKTSVGALDDIMNTPPDALNPVTFQIASPLDKYPKLKGFVEVRDIAFGYKPHGKPIIKNISLSLAPGKSIAVIGKSGHGKTTIAKLVAGLYTPWEGEILFDGNKRSEWSRITLANSMHYVEDVAFLFDGTVLENLTMMNPDIPHNVVFQAAKDACIHEEILSLKGGYNFLLEEQGVNLSVGQRVRLELARALITNPSILLLDQTTGEVEWMLEEQILRNLQHRGCAVLMITHRYANIKNFDEIILINEGEIQAKGTHEELLAQSPLYYELIKEQG